MWEYTIYKNDRFYIREEELEEVLNEYGNKGWELAGITNYNYKFAPEVTSESVKTILVFKRKKLTK